MPELEIGDTVRIQNQVGDRAKCWDLTGIIVESKGHQQYVVKVDGTGRLTMRNRQFLRRFLPYGKAGTPASDKNPAQIDKNPVEASPDIDKRQDQKGVRSRKPVDRLQVSGHGKTYKSTSPSLSSISVMCGLGRGGIKGNVLNLSQAWVAHAVSHRKASTINRFMELGLCN